MSQPEPPHPAIYIGIAVACQVAAGVVAVVIDTKNWAVRMHGGPLGKPVVPSSWPGLALFAIVVAAIGCAVVVYRHRLAVTAAEEARRQRLAAMREREEQAEYDRERRQREAAKTARAQAHATALKARQDQLLGLERRVLLAYAQFAATADFSGQGDQRSMAAGFIKGLGGLGIADLGLLRESQNPAVLKLIGDGTMLPPAPPALSPPISRS